MAEPAAESAPRQQMGCLAGWRLDRNYPVVQTGR